MFPLSVLSMHPLSSSLPSLPLFALMALSLPLPLPQVLSVLQPHWLLSPFAAQLLLTCSDPTAYPYPLGALAPRCQPQWSLTKGKAAAASSSPDPLYSALPNVLCSPIPHPMENGQEARPYLQGEADTHCRM